MMQTEERLLGRGKNAVLNYWENKLYIPKIYLNAEWSGEPLDVLAIDRDGSGDLHGALLFAARSKPGEESFLKDLIVDISSLMDRFASILVQYKYIVAVSEIREGEGIVARFPTALLDKSFSPDGIGRIGFLSVDFVEAGEPQTRVLLKPERFRAKVSKLADEYVEKHTADWEIRA
jgi:hypothetical protein